MGISRAQNVEKRGVFIVFGKSRGVFGYKSVGFEGIFLCDERQHYPHGFLFFKLG